MPSLILWQAQYDRPPEGLERGRWQAPWWIVAAIGAAVVILALVYLGVRLWRTLREKR